MVKVKVTKVANKHTYLVSMLLSPNNDKLQKSNVKLKKSATICSS